MFDNVQDTCWNSDQGSPQSITLDFLQPAIVEKVDITFQGGFVGQECKVEIGDALDGLNHVQTWYDIFDINDKQTLSLTSPTSARYLRLTFPSSTDFYGRVTIYSMEVYGEKP